MWGPAKMSSLPTRTSPWLSNAHPGLHFGTCASTNTHTLTHPGACTEIVQVLFQGVVSRRTEAKGNRMNSPLPHSITPLWHPYLPPPSVSTLAVYHLVLSLRLLLCVCGHVCVNIPCKPKCLSALPVMDEVEVDAVFSTASALCLDSWTYDHQSSLTLTMALELQRPPWPIAP